MPDQQNIYLNLELIQLHFYECFYECVKRSNVLNYFLVY